MDNNTERPQALLRAKLDRLDAALDRLLSVPDADTREAALTGTVERVLTVWYLRGYGPDLVARWCGYGIEDPFVQTILRERGQEASVRAAVAAPPGPGFSAALAGLAGGY